MKKFFIIVILVFIASICYSQITATTTSGKKVVLNADGTWKYADNSKIDERPCVKFHTGNLTIKNNTDKDIYFYYHFQGIYGYSPSVAKVKAKSSKTVNALTSIQETVYGNEQYKYAWKATLELQRNGDNISQMEGIENGNFVITECESIEVEVDN